MSLSCSSEEAFPEAIYGPSKRRPTRGLLVPLYLLGELFVDISGSLFDLLEFPSIKPEAVTRRTPIDNQFLLVGGGDRFQGDVALRARDPGTVPFSFPKCLLLDIHPDASVKAIKFVFFEPCPLALWTDIKHDEAILTEIARFQVDFANRTLHRKSLLSIRRDFEVASLTCPPQIGHRQAGMEVLVLPLKDAGRRPEMIQV
jgi:hypothetical protein